MTGHSPADQTAPCVIRLPTSPALADAAQPMLSTLRTDITSMCRPMELYSLLTIQHTGSGHSQWTATVVGRSRVPPTPPHRAGSLTKTPRPAAATRRQSQHYLTVQTPRE